jgi:hypothetical protein
MLSPLVGFARVEREGVKLEVLFEILEIFLK